MKFFGGKWYLAKKIHAAAPPKATYSTRAIAYGGALQEVWNWDHIGVSEVVNDIDLRLVNLWHCLRVPDLFEAMRREVELTPFGRPMFVMAQEAMKTWERESPKWEDSFTNAPSPFWAAMFFTLVRQSRGGDGKAVAPLTVRRTRRGMNEQAAAWWSAIEGLSDVHERLKRVVVEKMDALAFLNKYDSDKTFFYLDPPYMPDTRSAPKVYKYEMTFDEHVAMLGTLRGLKGRVLLSGYPHHVYEDHLTRKGWQRQEFDVTDNASARKSKRRKIEVLWSNYRSGGAKIA